MAVDWLEIGFIVALNGVFLLGLVVLAFGYVRKKYAVMKPQLLSEMEIWMGGAIGRFMQKLSEEAEKEGSEGSSSSSGAISLGGFKITPDLINSIAQLAQLAQQFGLIKGGGGGGTNPFLKG